MPQTQESTAVDAAAPPSPSNLAPDTGAPLSRSTLIRFGVGFFGISLLWAIGLNTVASVLLPQRLKDIGVDNPTALLGSISAVTALVSLVSNLVFGNLSTVCSAIYHPVFQHGRACCLLAQMQRA